MAHRKLMPAWMGAATLIGFSAATVQARGTKPPLQQLDIFKLERGSDAQISPDARTLAYVRSTPDIQTDRSTKSIWIVDLASGAQRKLVSRSADRPRWSPDGTRLAFTADDSAGASHLFVMAAGSATPPIALTAGDGEVQDFAWSPDGKQIAFTYAETFATPTIAVTMPEKPAGAHWAPNPVVVTSAHYSRDGSGIGAPTVAALYVVPSNGGSPRRIPTEGLDVDGAPTWDGAGGGLIFAAKPRSDTRGELWPAIYAAGLNDGRVRRLTTGPDAAHLPAASPDGRTIAYARYETGHPIWQEQLWLMDRDGGHNRRMSPALDRDVQDMHWMGDGRLAYSFGDEGLSTVAIAREGAPATIVTTRGDGGDFSIARDGTVGFALGSPQRPTESGVAGPAGVRRAAPLNDALLASRTLGHVVPFDAKSSFDGRRVPGWMILPPGYVPGRRYPTILSIHGGPWGDEGPLWRSDLQLFAAAGYAVIYPNSRGSTSYGFAYTDLLRYDGPQHDYDDLMDVVDLADARRIADRARLYVTGSSYGGIMTTWIVGKTRRFKAAVAEKPAVSLATSNLENDQYGSVALDPRGLPWTAIDRWWKSSPISLVGNVRTPTMLIVGEEDKRTPPGEAQMFYNALQLRDVPTALVLYPGASHETLGAPRSQLLSKTAYTLAWFARYR